MAEPSLKNKTLKGLAWNSVENFTCLGIQFIFGIILARLLNPSEYGILGMIAVFIAVSNTFITAGFGSALIRKQNRTAEDESTVFYFNIVVAIIFYGILFVCAPLIADFYGQPILTSVIRLMGVTLIIGAFSVVQNALLSSRLDFKTSAIVTISANVLSGTIGVMLAYKGCGVWSLVYQAILASFFHSVLLWILAKWRPTTPFCKESFKNLFSYGSKLMTSSLIDTIYTNIYPIIIGKLFSSASLGLYTRAQGYASLPSSNFMIVILRVCFPVLSKIQDDKQRLTDGYRKIMRMSAFIIFPCMMLLFGIADPLIRWMITDKWEGCIILLQIICFSVMWAPVHALNLNLLQVKGRSDLFLKIEIIKKTIGVAIIFVSYRWGVIGMCYGGVVSSFICLFINTCYTRKLINVGVVGQLLDVAPIFIFSVIAGVVTNYVTKIHFEYNIIRIALGGVTFLAIFGGLAVVFKLRELHDLIHIIKNKGKF